MMKKFIIFAAALAIIIFVAVLDYYTPKPLDWTPSFNENDKRPYGKYIITRVANKLFMDGITIVDSSFYQLSSNDGNFSEADKETFMHKGGPIYISRGTSSENYNDDNSGDKNKQDTSQDYDNIDTLDKNNDTVNIQDNDTTGTNNVADESAEDYNHSKVSRQMNYISISESYRPDPESVKELLSWVKKGNNVFISASDISKILLDTLKFKTYSKIHFSVTKSDTGKSNMVNFTNPNIKRKKSWFIQKSAMNTAISEFDTATTTVLGRYDNDDVNFISIKYGEGNFYFNTANFIFTNYNIVKPGNIDYADKALSYLPYDSKTLWSTEFSLDTDTPSTPLRYILSKPPLKWAYYLSILSVILFMIFKARRLQRIIPIISPLENATLNFTKTIADLYLYRRNNKGIAQKKAKHFLEFVRNKFGLRTHELDNDFHEKLTMKTGIGSEIINSIITEINMLDSWEKISDEHLQNFNDKIDYFYKRCNANFSLRK